MNVGYASAAASGIANFGINFIRSLDDLANLSGPPNWYVDAGHDENGFTRLAAASSTGPDPTDQADSAPLFSIQIGQTVHVRFSTLPRQVLDASKCVSPQAPCAMAGTGRLYFIGLRRVIPSGVPVIRTVSYRPGRISDDRLTMRRPAGVHAWRKSRIAPQIASDPYSLTGEVLLPGDPICDPAAIPSVHAASQSMFRSLSAGGSNSISIISPDDGQSFSLTDADMTATTLSFLANVSSGSSSQQQAISWTAALKYQPSQGSFGPYTDNRTLNSLSGSPVTSPYTGLGGQLKVTAKAQTCPPSSATATVTMIGSPVPIPDIQNYLLSIYQNDPNMATPKLLVQVAEDESRWLQFCTVGSTCQQKSQQAIFGSNGPWPVEGKLVIPKDGSDPTLHIGLMQVPLNQDTAWNWVKNADAGQKTFDNKFAYVRNAVKKIRGSRIGLRDLTPYEYENMALLQYGESPGSKYGNLYYVAACDGVPTNYQSIQTPTCNGQWDWQITSQNTKGVKYVHRVRNMQ